MPQETEGERLDRIHAAQLDDRLPPNSRDSYSQFQYKKGTIKQKTKVKPLIIELFEILPVWMREITMGLAVGLIPALLIALLLPGGFKLLSILVLFVAGGLGYMLGGKTA